MHYLSSAYFVNQPLHVSGTFITHHQEVKKRYIFSRYRTVVAQRVGRGIALLFHDRGTRSGQQHALAALTPGKDTVPILQEAGWAPGPVWTGGKSRPHRDSIPDRPARSHSLYRLSYPAHNHQDVYCIYTTIGTFCAF